MIGNMSVMQMWKRVAVLLVLLTACYWFVMTTYENGYDYLRSEREESTGYDSDQRCRYPILNPFDRSILPYYYYSPPLTCGHVQPELTYVEGEYVGLNWSLLQGNETIQYRFGAQGNWKLWNLSLFGWIYLSNIVEVRAHDGRANSTEYRNLHPDVHVDKEVRLEKRNRLGDHNGTENGTNNAPNVLIIVLDSMSRLSFIRSMPQTRRVLLETLNSIELKGYTKIDDNTFPNLLAVLTGHKVTIHGSELGGNVESDYVDHYPFIWKNFSEKGYITGTAEQYPGFIGSFAGFKSKPVDWWMRDFGSLASDCHHNHPIEEVILDSMYRFIVAQAERGLPFFLFSYIWKVTHGRSDDAMKLDHLYAALLQRIYESDHDNRTFIFVLGDHGPRFGDIRRTLIGRYEERMPYFSISMPPWFSDKYPSLINNLKDNVWRLSCHFDTYETLVDILNENYGDRHRQRLKNRGYSLFTRIPKFRTCEDAGISIHYCVCQEEAQLDVQSELVKSAMEFTLNHINHKLLANHSAVCPMLRLNGVSSAQKYKASDSVKYAKRYHYQQLVSDKNVDGLVSQVRISFSTSPGDGVFESLVEIRESNSSAYDGSFTISQVVDVSRINAFGRNGDCMKPVAPRLAKFCYCSGSGWRFKVRSGNVSSS